MATYDDGMNEDYAGESLFEELLRFLGTTVTIYTTSGGESGCGITGVVTRVTPHTIRVVTCIGPAPCCSLGSPCNSRICPCFNRRGGRGYGGYGGSGCINSVGSVADIPIDKIACFVHNAI
jgi:hypothetical protein